MDKSKLDRQFDRKIEKLSLSMAQVQDRKPIEEYNRILFATNLFFEDAEVQARVIKCLDRIDHSYNGVYLDERGPWILFKVIDVLEGDNLGLIDIGALVLAKWDNHRKTYTKYLYEGDPKPRTPKVSAMAAFTGTDEYEIAT